MKRITKFTKFSDDQEQSYHFNDRAELTRIWAGVVTSLRKGAEGGGIEHSFYEKNGRKEKTGFISDCQYPAPKKF